MKVAVGALVLAAVLAGCGGVEGRASVEAKLRAHLTSRRLSVKWVRCVPGPSSIYRCNVDFGDPHVQIYCASVVGGKLRAAEWRPAGHGRQDREASARECARRLSELG